MTNHPMTEADREFVNSLFGTRPEPPERRPEDTDEQHELRVLAARLFHDEEDER